MTYGVASRLPHQAVQGNIDPLFVASDKTGMLKAAEKILSDIGQSPAVFNLGHGFIPQTPIDHVAALSDAIKSFRRSGACA